MWTCRRLHFGRQGAGVLLQEDQSQERQIDVKTRQENAHVVFETSEEEIER